MDKTTEALQKLFELSKKKKNDEELEKILKPIGGQLTDVKFVLKRLFSKRYNGSIKAYQTVIDEQLTDVHPKSSVDVLIKINEDNRILTELQKQSPEWYDNLLKY